MSMGVEFLRKHTSSKARIHYVITNGGGQPNVVPAESSSWFYVRAPRRDQVDELYARVLKCAEGAATMTGTKVEVELAMPPEHKPAFHQLAKGQRRILLTVSPADGLPSTVSPVDGLAADVSISGRVTVDRFTRGRVGR